MFNNLATMRIRAEELNSLREKYEGKEFSDGEKVYRVIYREDNAWFEFAIVQEDGTLEHIGAELIEPSAKAMEQKVSMLEKFRQSSEKNKEIAHAEAEKQAEEQTKKDEREKYLNAYTSDMKPMMAAKIKNTLLKDYNKYIKMHDFIESAVKSGKKLEAVDVNGKMSYRLYSADNLYFEINKTAYDYGKHLEQANAFNASKAAPPATEDSDRRVSKETSTTTDDSDKSMYDIMTDLGLTYDEQRFILEYKSSGSYKINRKAYFGKALSDDDVSFVNGVNTALDKFPTYKGAVYRNVGFYDKDSFNAFVESHFQKPVTYSAFTSASKSKDSYPVDMPFVANLEIISENGKDVSEIGIVEEQEVLFKANTDFDVISANIVGNRATIILKERVTSETTDTDNNSGNKDSFEGSIKESESGKIPEGADRGHASVPGRRSADTSISGEQSISNKDGNDTESGEDIRRINSESGIDSLSEGQVLSSGSTNQELSNQQTDAKLTDKCEIIATKHTETGTDIWVVTLKERISSDEFKDLRSKVKPVGGYYSRFAKTPEGKAIPGFIFKSEPGAEEIKVFNDFFGNTSNTTASSVADGTQTENVRDKVYELVNKARTADPVDTKALEEIRDVYGDYLYSEALERVLAEIQADELIGKAKELKNLMKDGAKDAESQPEVLDRESEPDDGRLHTRASEPDVKTGTEETDEPHRDHSGERLSKSAGADGNKPDVRNDSEGIHGTDDAGTAVSEVRGTSAEITDTEPEVIETKVKTVEKKRPSNKGNFVITDDIASEFDNTPPSASDNIAAIELLLTLENEGRTATSEEMKTLAKYKGWGGIDTRRLPWELNRKMYDLFDGQQLRDMQSSQNNAFFTPTKVIDAMYTGLKRMGFKGGNVLETSMGVGNFFGRMPSAMTAKSALTGVELESYTARIAQYLYPGATVINMPFQDVAIKNGSYDLVIGNVPFGQNKISYNKKKYSLHNYFIISSLDKVRDGGIVAVITSAGTLDSHSIDARKAIMDRADVVACYKLPEKVFSRNASTDVQTDLLILRKRASDAKPGGDSILNTTTTKDGLRVNEYFVKHPENILGTLAKGTNAWGEITTVHQTFDFYDKLNAAMKKLPKDLISGNVDLKPIETIVSLSEKPRFFEKNGKIYSDDGAGTATEVSKTQANTVRDYMTVRDAYKDLLDAYDRDMTDAEIKPLRDALSKAYDNFSKKHGAITGDGKKKIGTKKSINNTFLEADADYYLVSGLERYDAKNNQFIKSALFEKDTLRKKKVTSVNVASDALAVSLNESGKIDFARMQELTGKTEKQLAEELKGEIVLTPEGDYVLTDIYLSGNIYEKLEAVKGKPEFKEQQEMLEKVIPTPKGASDITVKLGANYIDAKYIEQFASDILNSHLTIRKDISGRWVIEGVRQARYGDIVNVKYGCNAFNAVQLLEKILNDGEITATKKEGVGSKAVTVLDPEMTDIARQKADDIREAFETWVFANSERRTEIVDKYNRTYNNYRPLDYEHIAEKLSFDSMDETLKAKLYPHQKKGIARFLFGGNILFAHGVGTGKTFEMIASVMEAKRMGIINKAAMVVPNNKVVDFKNDIAQAYPNAKVLVIDTANKKRQTMLGLVNSNDWDIVLIARTTFTKIPVSRELQAHHAAQQLEELEMKIAEAEHDRNISNRQLKGLYTQRDNFEQKLKDLNSETKRDENSVDFEKLGIDCICVDEAHNYKSIMTPTKLDIKGLVNRNNAQMANDMLMKLDYIRSIDGKIIFGTGTPITNTVSEIYNMMRMVRPDILEDAGIRSLDEWVNTFAKIETTTEIGIDNQIKNKSTQVIRSFINSSEMIGMFRQFADIVFTGDVVKNLPKAVYRDVELEGTNEHRKIEEQIANVISKAQKSDLLKVYGQLMSMADAASVDLRMLSGADSPHNIFKNYSLEELEYEDSKINVMCDNVYQEYTASNDIKGTQIIFCDKGSGSGTVYSFNLHKDIMQKLIDRGIPADQIVIIKSQSDAQLEALYDKVNAGEVRVLIGTSQKMAEGLNVQKRVVAIHHPTVTYKPSDKEQGDARGVRAGNINDEVHIYRYLQKNTFDSHKWQAQDRKGEMINKALRGELVAEMEDIGADEESGAGVDAATAMAITSGNPLVKEKIDIDKEVVRLKTLQRNYLSEVYRYQDAISKNPGLIRQLTNYADNIEQDLTLRNKHGEKASVVIKGKTFEKQTDANKALYEAVKSAPKNGQYSKLGTYNDFDIMFKGDTGGMNYSLVLKGTNEYSVEYAGSGNNIARFAGVLNRLDAELKRVRTVVETLKTDLEFAKQEVTKPFEKEKELAEALEKQKDITYRYEHYGEKAQNSESNAAAEMRLFLEREVNNEESRTNLLDENGRRKNGISSSERTQKLGEDSWRKEGSSATERKEYTNSLGSTQLIPETAEDGYGNCAGYIKIKESAWNSTMKELATAYGNRGLETIFCAGPVFVELHGNYYEANGAVVHNKIIISYDTIEGTPEQVSKHEYTHLIYDTERFQQAKKRIMEKVSVADLAKAIEDMAKFYKNSSLRADYFEQELLCNVVAGVDTLPGVDSKAIDDFWKEEFSPDEVVEDSSENEKALSDIGYSDNPTPLSNDKEIKLFISTVDKDVETLTPERKKEILEQFDKDRAGFDKPTQKQLWGERAAWVAHNMTRVFPEIPERGERGTFFAEFRKNMIQWKVLPNTSSFMVQDKLNKMTDGLTPEEFKTFSELVYFLDLQEEAKLQKERGYDEILLPNEISPREVDAIIEELNDEASDKVKDALVKRKNIWNELKDQYIALNQYIGFDTDNKFKRENYYHHQVIEYMANRSKGTGSREISVKAGRGWLRERHGSTQAINTDFLAVEYQALLQMQYDVYIANMLGKIKAQYDIKPQLEQEAFRNNKQRINDIITEEATGKDGEIILDSKGKPDSETYRTQQWYNQRIMFGFSGLFELAENDLLPTFGGEYDAVISALARQNLNVPGLYNYVGTLAQLSDITTDDQEQAVISARTVLKYTAQKKAWIRETLGKDYQTWETLAKSRDDVTIHQPRKGNYFYTKTTVDEDAFNKAFNDMVTSLVSGENGIETTTDIKELFAQYSDTVRLVGAAYEQWVLPNEIVTVMDKVANPKQTSDGAKVARGIMSAWKGWATSVNPLRTIKFGIRNIWGDLDAVIAGNPRVTIYSKQAVKEIHQAMKHKKYSPTFMEWVERGGYTSMIFANEMDTEMQDKLFAHLQEKSGPEIFKIPAKLWEGYYNGVEYAHNFREAILRYSAYLYYKDAIAKNKGNVKDNVASNRYIIRGLQNAEDKAYQLSKDLLGAYDEVGAMGQTLRRYWVPFYSFTETNLKRYYRMFENIIASDDTIAKKAGKLLLKGLMVNMLGLILLAWNKLVMKDEDEQLPPSVRNVPHITLGKIGDNVYAFRQVGSFSELLEWFGLDDYKWTEEDLTAPLDKVWGMITPFVKTPIELASGLNFYPSITQPRAIRDKAEHLFSSFGLDDVYREVTGKPTKGAGDIAKGAFVYSYDYKESAYYEILDIKREYQGDTDSSIYAPTRKSNALYYMKTAVRYKDKEAALKYLDEYFENGGTGKGITQSFAMLNPMYGFTGEDTAAEGEAFIASLTPEQKEKLVIAQKYYEEDLMLPEEVAAKLRKKDITNEEAKNLLTNYINAKCK